MKTPRPVVVLLVSIAIAACGGEIDSMPLTPGSDAGVTGDGFIPRDEICDNQIDDDQNGLVDEGCSCSPTTETTQGCYPGPVHTRNVGACRDGNQTCVEKGAEFASWGECEGAVLPEAEICDDGIDNDCNGKVDDGAACGKGDNPTPDAGVPKPDTGSEPDQGGGNNNHPDCGPHNCFGCCDPGGVCRAPSAQFCGAKGVACRSCGAGQCLPAFGTCDNDKVDVYLVSFKLQDDGVCGPFDDCDLYAKATFGPHKGETKTDSGDTFNLNSKLFSVTRKEILQHSLRLEIFDHDGGLRFDDEALGICAFGFPPSAVDAGSWMTHCSSDIHSVKFAFKPR